MMSMTGILFPNISHSCFFFHHCNTRNPKKKKKCLQYMLNHMNYVHCSWVILIGTSEWLRELVCDNTYRGLLRLKQAKFCEYLCVWLGKVERGKLHLIPHPLQLNLTYYNTAPDILLSNEVIHNLFGQTRLLSLQMRLIISGQDNCPVQTVPC